MLNSLIPSVTALSVAAVGSLAFGVAGPVSAAPGADAANAPSGRLTNFGFDAAAYGSRTSGNPNADSDATAASYLPCTRYVPRSRENFVATAGDGDGVSLDAVSTRNHTLAKDGAVSSISTVKIDSGSLANGQIEFTNLRGRVRSFHDAGGYHVAAVSSLGSLSIGGLPVVLGTDGQELEIPVPGAGTLFLNRTRANANGRRAVGTVNVMRFEANNGTIEQVGRAGSRLDGNVDSGVFGGGAWGSDGRVGDLAAIGRDAFLPIPCAGTFGKIHESSTAEGTLPGAVVGVRRSFVYGVQKANDVAKGYTRSVVARGNFGDGVLKFRSIKARANVLRQGDGDVISSPRGTGVGKILVNGQQVAIPPAGEPQHVGGLGSYTVQVVKRTPIGIEVTGVVVRLENSTPKDRTDDTVVNLARAVLRIKKG